MKSIFIALSYLFSIKKTKIERQVLYLNIESRVACMLNRHASPIPLLEVQHLVGKSLPLINVDNMTVFVFNIRHTQIVRVYLFAPLKSLGIRRLCTVMHQSCPHFSGARAASTISKR